MTLTGQVPINSFVNRNSIYTKSTNSNNNFFEGYKLLMKVKSRIEDDRGLSEIKENYYKNNRGTQDRKNGCTRKHYRNYSKFHESLFKRSEIKGNFQMIKDNHLLNKVNLLELQDKTINNEENANLEKYHHTKPLRKLPLYTPNNLLRIHSITDKKSLTILNQKNNVGLNISNYPRKYIFSKDSNDSSYKNKGENGLKFVNKERIFSRKKFISNSLNLPKLGNSVNESKNKQ